MNLFLMNYITMLMKIYHFILKNADDLKSQKYLEKNFLFIIILASSKQTTFSFGIFH